MRASIATVFTAIWFLSVFAQCPTAWGDEIIGSVKTVKGSATILRNGKSSPAIAGKRLFMRDNLRTGIDGSMGVIFRDDTILSLGPSSEILIDEFVFDPAGGNMSFVTKMTKGTAAFLTGKISELSPKSVKVETPSATIGIRGTKFVVKVDP